MNEDWYKVERTQQIRDGIIERVIPSTVTPGYLQVYGTWQQEDGTQSSIQLLDWAKLSDQMKLRPKAWIRQIIIWEKYLKKGKWFARKYKIALCITMVRNEEIEMWERLELE